MADDLQELIERARKVTMSPKDKEAQRRSFVFGNTNIENERITRATVDEAARTIAREKE